MSDSRKIGAFVQRVLADEDVSFAEIENLKIDNTDDRRRALIDRFWRELAIAVNDFDIRMREPDYNRDKKTRLLTAAEALVDAGLLPRLSGSA